MPTPQIPSIPGDANVQQLRDGIIGINRYLNYLLSSLDTLNINRLDAKVIKTGTLDANLVTIRSDLTGSYVQMDGDGIYTYDTITGYSLLLNGKGFTSYDELSNARISLDITAQTWGAADPTQLKFLTSGGIISGSVGTNSQGSFYLGAAAEKTLLFGDPIQLESGLQRIDMFGSLNETSIRGFTKFYNDVTFSVGNVSFTGSISGLSTSVVSDHNHGLTPGRYVLTYDDATGTNPTYQVWNASGGHSHSIGVA